MMRLNNIHVALLAVILGVLLLGAAVYYAVVNIARIMGAGQDRKEAIIGAVEQSDRSPAINLPLVMDANNSG